MFCIHFDYNLIGIPFFFISITNCFFFFFSMFRCFDAYTLRPQVFRNKYGKHWRDRKKNREILWKSEKSTHTTNTKNYYYERICNITISKWAFIELISSYQSISNKSLLLFTYETIHIFFEFVHRQLRNPFCKNCVKKTKNKIVCPAIAVKCWNLSFFSKNNVLKFDNNNNHRMSDIQKVLPFLFTNPVFSRNVFGLAHYAFQMLKLSAQYAERNVIIIWILISTLQWRWCTLSVECSTLNALFNAPHTQNSLKERRLYSSNEERNRPITIARTIK